MTIDKKNPKHIIADEGKVFQRKSDGFIYGNEIYLGFTYYLNGEKLTIPYEEQAEDFTEIDDPNPKEEENNEPNA